MPKGIMVVQSYPAPADEDEFNGWYSNTHIPQVCKVPGITGARRYKLTGADPNAPAYLAIYEIDADDLTAPVKELRARSASGEIEMSEVLGRGQPPVVTFYELIE